MGTTGDLLGTGVSGLLAFQRALATTGHNISNVNTPGYSRQRAELAARPAQFVGVGYIGMGVNTAAVTRVYDGFLTAQTRAYTASHGDLAAYHGLASDIDRLLGDSQSSLSSSLSGFFKAIQDVANDPSSVSARQVMLGAANTLASRFHYLDARLTEERTAVNTRIKNSVNDINSYAEGLADINRQIVLALGAGQGAPPNDLLDQRDVLIEKLAEQVSVSVVAQDDGALNVFIGNGQSLVTGAEAFRLTTTTNRYDATRLEVNYAIGGGELSEHITGGGLGAALRFRDELLDPTQNALGRIATGLALTFNARHREGMNLSGTLGTDFFSAGGPVVNGASTNTGTGTVTATISSATALTTSDYLARYSTATATWTVTRLSDGTAWTGAGPFSIDGLTLTPGGAPANGDSFLIRPTRNGADDFAVATTDVNAIAAAAPIRTRVALANTGQATISAGEVLDATHPNLLVTTTINFVAGGYQVNGVGAVIPYTSGANIDLNGWRVAISGTPTAGDVFTIEANLGGVSDNRNALRLAALASTPLLDNGSATYDDAYGALTAQVGSATRSADLNRQAQSALLTQTQEARAAVSGVNLDEEAANLQKLQQAYQAAAQTIAVANTLFDEVLSAMRR